MTPTRPALRWHGGKWRLAPWIISHFPPHRVYIEPFGGAGSVLLRKPRVHAEVYNDLDGEVVNLFRVLRDRRMAAELQRLLRLTPYSRVEYKSAYRKPPPQSQMVERARLLSIRSWMGHGSNSHNLEYQGGFRQRFDKSGTTPSHDWAHFPDCLDALVERLQGVVIENRDAAELMQTQDSPQTLHYCDPPYVHSTRSGKRQRDYTFEMTDAQHEALADVLHGLKGMVVLSGYHSQLYDRLYKGWATVEKATYGDKAVKRVEVLWLNQAAACRQQGTLF